MRSTLALALVLVLAGSPSLANDESKKAMEEGDAHVTKREYEEALVWYKRALAAEPGCAKAHAGIGTALACLGKFEEAYAAYDKALEIDKPAGSVSMFVHQQKGLLHVSSTEWDKAVDEFKKAIAIHEDDFSWRNLGVTYAKMEKWKDAADAFERSLALKPDQPQVKLWLEETRKHAAAAPKGDAKDGEEKKPPEEERKAKEGPDATFELPAASCAVATPDLATLIVAVPAKAELVYYDTIKLKETKKVALDFQPSQLAVQGKTLFATARGGSQVHALDLESGKVVKTFKVPGEAVSEIACHRTKGNLWVSNAKEEVFAIDPRAGTVAKTNARGSLLAADPSGGAFLYTASDGKDGRSVVRKFAIKGKELAALATNKSAAILGRSLHVSPDGKRVCVIGSGGFEPTSQSSVGVFGTDDMVTTLGQIEAGSAPEGVVFHPAAATGAVLGEGGDLVEFHARSLVQTGARKVPAKGPKAGNGWIVLAGRGTRIALWRPGEGKENGKLLFYSVALSPQDAAANDKAFPPPK